MRLLTASESSGWLVAAEMDRAGLPWSAEAHRALLTELLGERFAGGGEPRRLTELADQVSTAFGRRVRPDLPADVLKAFKQAGHQLKTTRRWELQTIDHPAVEPLIEYKKLYRIYTANGWTWLNDWVHDGRFRPGFVPGGTVSGRWITNGGGGLQIPKVIRRAVVADPGWRLVVADASQMEPRVLAAISRDPGLMEVAGNAGDLYKAVSDKAFSGDRAMAKLAVLGAVYGQTSGDGLKNLAVLRKRFPKAVAYVDDAARAGEEGQLVSTWLGRTCPPDGAPIDAAMLEGPPADEPQKDSSPGARPRPLHQELRGPGQCRRLGVADDGGAPADDRAVEGRAGVLPARRGDRPLPRRRGRSGRGRDPGSERPGRPDHLRRDPDPLPLRHRDRRVLRRRQVIRQA